LENTDSEKDGLVKTLSLSIIALMGLATASVAAPLADMSSGPASPGLKAIPVGQNTLPNSGTVSEVISAGQYTYLHVMRDGKGTWLAIPQRDVPVGTEIQYAKGMVMKDFHSSSLERTFETVLFLSGVQMAGETAVAPAGHPPIPAAPAGHGGLPNGGKVAEAIAAGQYTYLQVAQDGKETWLAIPKRDVPVGAEIRYGQGAIMKDFHSSSLDRTFAEVLFLGGVTLAEE
jgi:hypothetical protein